MSIVSRTYDLFCKFKEIVIRKSFKILFFSFTSIFLFFGSMNAYASSDTMQITPDWEGMKIFCNLGSGLSEDKKNENNMTSHWCQSGENVLWGMAMFMLPEATSGSAAIMESDDVPGDLKTGLMGLADNAISYAYTNLPSVDVLAHLQEEWVPGYDSSNTSLYAAESTSGYDSLMDSGIAPLWTRIRDISYIFFVVIMIVVGFMIMFRNKIGGQLVVGIGNTIPSIIASLILVTFSFAIAGLVIDLGGFIISLIAGIFDGNAVSTQNIGNLMKVLFRGLGEQGAEAIRDEIENVIGTFSSGTGLEVVGLLYRLGFDVGTTVATSGMNVAVVGVVALFIFLICLGIVFVGAIKLIIVMYKAYFQLILNVILGPIQIMLGALPGQDASRTNWLLGIVRNVLVFPIIYFIINIPVYLSSISDDTGLAFPAQLTGETAGANSGMDIPVTEGTVGFIFLFIFRVFVLYYAAQAPKFAEAIIPPVMSNASKAGADAMVGAKANLSKIPLIGGLFK